MKVLVVNAGSSSLKYQLFNLTDGQHQVMCKGLCERIGIAGSNIHHETAGGKEFDLQADMPDHTVAVKLVIDAILSPEHGVLTDLNAVSAVGHRVVHGGEKFAKSVLINAEVKQAIKACYPLAPLHNPANMMGIEACEKAMPGIPQVAVFDTAFHQTIPEAAYMYALPYDLYKKHGIRRYGFHGTSHAYVADQTYQMLGKPDAKIITCHLGNGSSISAIKAGKCIDTSMGMTPLAGVPMGTRCGDIDPAIVTFLMQQEKITSEEADKLMNKQSGFLGISGVSSDCRDLESAKDSGNARAKLALDMFYYNCHKVIGSYVAALDGVDAIVFTAGIGENSSNTRAGILKGFDYLGLKLDEAANQKRSKENLEISRADSKVKVFVVRTDEELRIAQDTAALTK